MKKMIALICAMALVAGLTGCTSDNNPAAEKAAVCYVLQNTANSQGMNLNSSPLVQKTVYQTIRNFGYVSVVNADGLPKIVTSTSFDIDRRFKKASAERLDMDAKEKTSNFIAGMQSVTATDPEVDILEALRLAVRSLSVEGYDSKTIVFVGTGLSTTGVLNFQNNLLSAEPDAVVELLREKGEIPDFSGITVHFQQLGDVAAPQASLTAAQRNKLQKIYKSIVEAGGGTFVQSDIVANPVNKDNTYPTVTPVDLPADEPIRFDPEMLTDDAFTEPFVLTEEQVTFTPDTAEYLDPDKVTNTLKPIADYLSKNQVTILLCGTTAGDVINEPAIQLSEERSERVRQTLVDLGIAPERMIAVGLGPDNPWHVSGAGFDGAAASGNRSVVLLDATSETAQSILDSL